VNSSRLTADTTPAVPYNSAGEVKAELITLLVDIVARHQRARAQVTDDIVDAFMAVRPFKCFAS
jgi:hypothetical protein